MDMNLIHHMIIIIPIKNATGHNTNIITIDGMTVSPIVKGPSSMKNAMNVRYVPAITAINGKTLMGMHNIRVIP